MKTADEILIDLIKYVDYITFDEVEYVKIFVGDTWYMIPRVFEPLFKEIQFKLKRLERIEKND